MKKISIIALGWLGNSLYDFLEQKGHHAIGTYHSTPKNKKNEVHFDFHHSTLPDQVLRSDLIIFNLTPSVMSHADQFKKIVENLTQKIIFISSTSVYGQDSHVTENDTPLPTTKNGILLKECEEFLLKRGRSTIIRPAGLYGGDRHPGKYLAGKKGIIGPHSPVNLISREDLIGIIDKCIEHSEVNVINAVNSAHPTKKEYYQNYCLNHSLEIPEFTESDMISKQVDTQYSEFRISRALP